MALLAVGFSLIVIGDTVIGDIVDMIFQRDIAKILEELVEIAGFGILILAVKRS